jgi:DNA-binding response OmpR family regulator
MKKILLVEDDNSLGTTLKERLEKEGYLVQWATTVAKARTAAANEFDIAILDIGLPDGDGFELASSFKGRMPIIFMTALNSAENRLRGYETGAEEFIPKPFHLRELLMRVQHVFENHALEKVLHINGRTVNLSALIVKQADGSTEALQARDGELLKLLVAKAPSVVSRDEILNQIWGEDKFPSQRTVDNSIVRLRSAIGDKDGHIIRSVRGVGYQWLPEGEK